MPSIVGNIKFVAVTESATVIIGDSVVLLPLSTSKEYSGSGSFNIGDFAIYNNLASFTNTNDQDLFDSNG
jgi:hypothetical protein